MSSELPNQYDERDHEYSLFTALAIYVAAVVASLVVLAGLWQLFLLIFGD
jgi:hypothetical protein